MDTVTVMKEWILNLIYVPKEVHTTGHRDSSPDENTCCVNRTTKVCALDCMEGET